MCSARSARGVTGRSGVVVMSSVSRPMIQADDGPLESTRIKQARVFRFLRSGTPTGPVDLDHEHPGLRVPEVRPERSSRIIRTVLTFGTVLGWISGGQSLVRCHLPCPLLWRDGNRAVASCCHCP